MKFLFLDNRTYVQYNDSMRQMCELIRSITSYNPVSRGCMLFDPLRFAERISCSLTAARVVGDPVSFGVVDAEFSSRHGIPEGNAKSQLNGRSVAEIPSVL